MRYPDTVVTGARGGTVIPGTATKAQFFLEYNDAGRAHGLPPSLWLKAGFEAHSARSAPLYAAEVNFYRDLAPRLPINCPTSFFEGLEPESGSGVLLLEDLGLRDVRFGDPTDRIDAEMAARVLDLQARFHAVPRLPDLQADKLIWLRGGGAIDAVNVVDEYIDFWETAARQPRFAFVTGKLQDRELMRRTVHQMRANDRVGRRDAFVHGDSHPGNMFFEPDGGVGLLDWQTCQLGEWAADVAYFLVLALSVEDRRRHERDLLQHYLDRLAASGVAAPTFDEAWLSYRQHAAWCFLTTLCPVERQPEAVCMTWAERACAAILDLETIEALAA